MVATSLPFWMQQANRTMVPFSSDDRDRGGLQPARARRAGVRRPTGNIIVETCPALEIEQHVEAWGALARRSIEPNVFMDPGFVMPAVLHFAAAERPLFVLCWEHDGAGEPALIGLLALSQKRSLLSPRVAVAWAHPQWVASAPLLDRERGSTALDALLGWLAARGPSRDGLLVRGLRRGGPLARLLDDGGRRGTAVLATRSRAIIDNAAAAPSGPSAKRVKEMRRQWRRLGPAEVTSAESVEEVRGATEQFLALEARGWKGASRTALLADTRLATFARTMTRLLAAEGRCRIDTLWVEGRPAAMGIVLRSGDRAFYWKTAYDEAFHRHSPGKQLALAIGTAQRADPTLGLTDSCAVPDHPMIDALWTDRMSVVDLLVAGPSDGRAGFNRAVAQLRLADTARATLKAAYHRLRRTLRR